MSNKPFDGSDNRWLGALPRLIKRYGGQTGINQALQNLRSDLNSMGKGAEEYLGETDTDATAYLSEQAAAPKPDPHFTGPVYGWPGLGWDPVEGKRKLRGPTLYERIGSPALSWTGNAARSGYEMAMKGLKAAGDEFRETYTKPASLYTPINRTLTAVGLAYLAVLMFNAFSGSPPSVTQNAGTSRNGNQEESYSYLMPETNGQLRTEPYLVKLGDTLSKLCDGRNFIRSSNDICVDRTVEASRKLKTSWNTLSAPNRDLIYAGGEIQLPLPVLGVGWGP